MLDTRRPPFSCVRKRIYTVCAKSDICAGGFIYIEAADEVYLRLKAKKLF